VSARDAAPAERLVFLGTGTSVGIPMIGCDCAVCRSGDPRNHRRRTSLYLAAAGRHVVVDTPPDFREQVLAYGVPRVDAVLFTHSHADHLFGFDDIRRFNTIQDSIIPAYGHPDTMADVRRVFNYIGDRRNREGLMRPLVTFHDVEEPFNLGDLRVQPLPVEHGERATYGYLFETGRCRVAFVPDCHAMVESVVERLRGVDIMILDALRHRPHPTHLTVAQSLELLGRIGAGEAYLVHMCHDLDHAATSAILPAGVHVSYDGLTLSL